MHSLCTDPVDVALTLVLTLDRRKLHDRPGDRLAHHRGVGGVFHLTTHTGLHRGLRDQPHPMPDQTRQTAPTPGTGARSSPIRLGVWRLKNAVATRYGKTARTYLAGLCIVAAIILWAK